MRVEWSLHARTDLRELKAYIAKDSPFYARRFIERIITAVGKLSQPPHLGRLVPEAQRDDVRELLIQHYRVIYQTKDERLCIVTVVHGSRDLIKQDPPPWKTS
ncbi:MAG: plasmid stabilization protein [Nitrospirales bacterium]|nr:MAG: plasmid stabilization protein [Nitrospirales bacterium]